MQAAKASDERDMQTATASDKQNVQTNSASNQFGNRRWKGKDRENRNVGDSTTSIDIIFYTPGAQVLGVRVNTLGVKKHRKKVQRRQHSPVVGGMDQALVCLLDDQFLVVVQKYGMYIFD